MFERIRKLLGAGSAKSAPAPVLPPIARDDIAHLLRSPHGLPVVDWGFADAWIRSRHASVDPALARRAVMAACLDEIRDQLEQDHRRWRSAKVEGLAPLEGLAGPALAETAETACRVLERDLRVIRGDAPIPPFALVAVEPYDAYVDFTSAYFPDAGSYATSGGLYLNDGPDSFPIIAANTVARHAVAQIAAHEITHHALRECRLPLFIEEGLTQMMEERVTGIPNFKLDNELVARQRERWGEGRLGEYLAGHGFSSPEDDTQELSYALSQWLVRAELSERPKPFFEFLRRCRDLDADLAFQEVFGETISAWAASRIGVCDESD